MPLKLLLIFVSVMLVSSEAENVMKNLLHQEVSNQNTVAIFLGEKNQIDLNYLTKVSKSMRIIDVEKLTEALFVPASAPPLPSTCVIVTGNSERDQSALTSLIELTDATHFSCVNVTLIGSSVDLTMTQALSILRYKDLNRFTIVDNNQNKSRLVVYNVGFDCKSKQYTPEIIFNSTRQSMLPDRLKHNNDADISNMKFRITTTSYSEMPFAYAEIDPTNQQRILLGVEVEMIKILAQVHGFELEFVDDPVISMFGELLDNGTWSGVVGKVYRNEADIGFGDLSITETRMQVVDFTFPFFIESNLLLYRKPPPESRLYVIIRPFQATVWLLIIVTLFFAFTLFYNASGIWKNENNDKSSKVLLFLFGAILKQYTDVRPDKWFGRAIVVLWVFFSLIVATIYQSGLISRLSTQNYPALINSFEEVIAAGYSLLVPRGTSSESYLAELGTHYDHLKELMETRKLHDLGSTIDESTMTDKTIFFITIFYAISKFSTSLSKNYIFSKTGFFPNGLGWALRRGVCYKDYFDKSMLELSQSGIPMHLLKKFLVIPKLGKPEKEALNLAAVSIAFVVLISGIVLSMVAFLLEVIYSKVKRHKR